MRRGPCQHTAETAEPNSEDRHTFDCLTGWNAGFHTWVMVGYGFELLEYCRRERFPGGLWDQLTLDFGLVTLLSIVIYLLARAAIPPAIPYCTLYIGLCPSSLIL